MFSFEQDEVYDKDDCLAVWKSFAYDAWYVDELLAGDFVNSLLTNIDMCCLEYGEHATRSLANMIIHRKITKLWYWQAKTTAHDIDIGKLKRSLQCITSSM